MVLYTPCCLGVVDGSGAEVDDDDDEVVCLGVGTRSSKQKHIKRLVPTENDNVCPDVY